MIQVRKHPWYLCVLWRDFSSCREKEWQKVSLGKNLVSPWIPKWLETDMTKVQNEERKSVSSECREKHHSLQLFISIAYEQKNEQHWNSFLLNPQNKGWYQSPLHSISLERCLSFFFPLLPVITRKTAGIIVWHLFSFCLWNPECDDNRFLLFRNVTQTDIDCRLSENALSKDA